MSNQVGSVFSKFNGPTAEQTHTHIPQATRFEICTRGMVMEKTLGRNLSKVS
jgi:hypothetical protein